LLAGVAKRSQEKKKPAAKGCFLAGLLVEKQFSITFFFSS
jgi:hypothetical protein